MRYLVRGGGVRICYETFGSGDRVPVLLTHGFASSASMWAPNVAALAADRRCITWDMRGHGHTTGPDDQAAYTAANTVADMLALLDQHGADRAVLGGLSLGGYMSLSFYLAHPERVAALMLFDTGPGFRNDEARQRWNERAVAQAERIDRDGLAALGADGERHDSASGVAMAARGMLTQRDGSVIDSLPAIAVPTLVLVGSEDTPFVGAANYMAAKIPGAKLAVIEGAGHVSNADAPDDFNARVLEFLAELG